MQPKILHLVKHDRDNRYTILMEPLLLHRPSKDGPQTQTQASA